jgi:hypothetical protein
MGLDSIPCSPTNFDQEGVLCLTIVVNYWVPAGPREVTQTQRTVPIEPGLIAVVLVMVAELALHPSVARDLTCSFAWCPRTFALVNSSTFGGRSKYAESS